MTSQKKKKRSNKGIRLVNVDETGICICFCLLQQQNYVPYKGKITQLMRFCLAVLHKALHKVDIIARMQEKTQMHMRLLQVFST